MKSWADRDPELTRRLVLEDSLGEDLLAEYARENGMAVPVDAATVDLAAVTRKKPLALVHSSVLRKRFADLIAASLDIDYGKPFVEYVPGEFDEKGEGRPPRLVISPDLAERYPFKTRKLRKIFRELPPAEPTPALRAWRELKRVLDSLGASTAFSWAGGEPIDEAKIRETFVAWYKDMREFRRRQTQGGAKRRGGPRPRSQRAADEALKKDLGFRSWEALQAFMRPSRARRMKNP